ncbi:peptidase inhibitor family I36 protein [Streptomyces chattanoogensis]|uniref:peptidase inhibitor family I36 protein n=1 Tax=Streptomyces chattanoogensis TaxID=66876 RepID=UPI0036A523DB
MRIRYIAAAGAAAALALGVSVPAFAEGHAGVAPRAAHSVAADHEAFGAKRLVVFWEDGGYEGKHQSTDSKIPKLSKYGWNDTISSAKNKGNRTVTFHQHTHYEGAKLRLGPGESEAHFGDRNFGDKASSISFS